ncbi:Inner membrane ABC transporter ATP-binding protein YddA [Pigmentiphaga humi]|uniref:Inner membrane ABC transporter ATP-binding protein YddA n=1 Tax=Pigmentiphaga humi TaxID=2478468 RepID=A0A3P4AXD6_9BURK|nr:ABC transporter ATP-binding protein/permease [Pigmentiphaga humi]VCU68060.1 Inner membrane ABC transporter ATP-binding protein YddA [Pigmentiphaga humi]
MSADTSSSAQAPLSPNDIRGRLRLRATWRLLKPYWVSEDRKAALGLLALVVGLNLALVAANVWLTNWNRVFYNALEVRDFAAFKLQLAHFCAIAAAFIVIAIMKQYYTMMLEMRWRTWLTGQWLRRWTTGQAYYRVEQTHGADNPDQRIAEDLRTLAGSSLTLSLGLLNSVVTLLSFVTLLWMISGPLVFALGGRTIAIPGYMVWFAVLYAAAGSWLTHKIGKPLIGLSFRQEQTEADFRYALMRLRENAEGIALYGGEPAERAGLHGAFGHIRENWRGLMIYTRRLVFVNSGYGQIAIVFPLIVAAPNYFSGAITLGVLMQIASAFGQVQGALSWFVDGYASLVNWQAAANRLLDFGSALQSAETEHGMRDGEHGIAVTERAGSTAPGAIEAAGLVLALPGQGGGRTLTAPFSMTVRPGERLLVTGPSGAGKSVLFRAMAGIWPYGGGSIAVPAGARTLFLPQRSYIPAGTLAAALNYPSPPGTHGGAALADLLRDCRLDRLTDKLQERDNWAMRLSPGEQQRLAFARAILQQPDYLFLDEATSALDEETEAALYALLVERLPRAAIVSIAHRSTVARWHDRHLRYRPVREPGSEPRYLPTEESMPAGMRA